MSFLTRLDLELAQVGIRGRLRRRILAEADDHLQSDAGALRRAGSARELAEGFAADLGTRATRRLALETFLALAVSGGVYAAAFVSASSAGSTGDNPPGASIAFSLAGWWTTFTLIGSFVATGLLALCAVGASRAFRIKPHVAGAAGDVFDDLGLPSLRPRPWRFALRVAVGAGALGWLAGIVAADPFDGLLRGALEGMACLAGFRAFGRYLGFHA